VRLRGEAGAYKKKRGLSSYVGQTTVAVPDADEASLFVIARSDRA